MMVVNDLSHSHKRHEVLKDHALPTLFALLLYLRILMITILFSSLLFTSPHHTLHSSAMIKKAFTSHLDATTVVQAK